MFFEGLKVNEDRYGYPSCPCRLATGNFELDRDIICPCDYRDPDVVEYGACYCRLYINKAVYESKNLPEVPERRSLKNQESSYRPQIVTKKASPQGPKEIFQDSIPSTNQSPEISEVRKKLWYCKQCGYVVFREDPPFICPICKAKKEMFAEIKSKSEFNG